MVCVVPGTGIPVMLCAGPYGSRRSLPCGHATPYFRILDSGVGCYVSVLRLYCFRPDTAATPSSDELIASNRRQHSHVQPLDRSPGEHTLQHLSERARHFNTRRFTRAASCGAECWP